MKVKQLRKHELPLSYKCVIVDLDERLQSAADGQDSEGDRGHSQTGYRRMYQMKSSMLE